MQCKFYSIIIYVGNNKLVAHFEISSFTIKKIKAKKLLFNESMRYKTKRWKKIDTHKKKERDQERERDR